MSLGAICYGNLAPVLAEVSGVTSSLERTYISHLWSTPVVVPFYRGYDVLRQSSAARKAL